MGKISRSFDAYSILEKGFALKITETKLFSIKMDCFTYLYSFLKSRFTSCKTEQPLQGLELQEKEQKD